MSRAKGSFKRLVFTTLGVSVLFITQSVPALAATTSTQPAANGFQISPVREELTIAKGQSETITITVANPTATQSTVKAVVDDFEASSDESGEPQLLLNGATADPAHDFKQLVNAIPNLTVPAKGSKDINVTLTIPKTANSGGYYGAIRFVPSGSTGSGNVGLTASVGTLFLITVPGNLIEKLTLTQLSAAQNNQATSFITSGKVQVLNRLDNVGDIHVQPFGKVYITSMSGNTVASYEFNNTTPRGNILPGSIRKFIDPLSRSNWFGHYTIHENLAYSNGSGSLLTATAGFWYLPVWFLIALAVVVLVIVALIYRFVHGRRSRHHGRPRR